MKGHHLLKLAAGVVAAWAFWRLYQARRLNVPWALVLRFPFVPVADIGKVHASAVGDIVRDQLLAQMNAGPRPITANVRAAAAGVIR